VRCATPGIERSAIALVVRGRRRAVHHFVRPAVQPGAVDLGEPVKPAPARRWRATPVPARHVGSATIAATAGPRYWDVSEMQKCGARSLTRPSICSKRIHPGVNAGGPAHPPRVRRDALEQGYGDLFRSARRRGGEPSSGFCVPGPAQLRESLAGAQVRLAVEDGCRFAQSAGARARTSTRGVTPFAYLNRGRRSSRGGEWLWSVVVPQAPGLIWLLGVVAGDVMVDGSIRREGLRPLGLDFHPWGKATLIGADRSAPPLVRSEQLRVPS
jgi:hypothetical protein